MRELSTAECMAVAVLRGDTAAARGLADLLVEEYGEGAVEIKPLKLTVSKKNGGRLRALVFVRRGAEVDTDQIRQLCRQTESFLNSDDIAPRALALQGVERVELYEIPN